MSSETGQEIAGLLALVPRIAFVLAILWCQVLEFREGMRTAYAAEQGRPLGSEKRARRPSTNP